MAKFSILKAAELREEENEIQSVILRERELEEARIEFERRKTMNPYWGLKCNRGLWLTRFPLESLPNDPEFTMAYVQAGGGFDAMGHWGITPQHLSELECQGWSHKEVALLAQFVPESLCRYEGVNPKNYKTLERGLKRADALGKNGVEYSCSVWTLGSMPIEKFLKRLFKNGIRLTRDYGLSLEINYLLVYRPYYEGHHTVYGGVNTALEAVSEGASGRRIYDIEKILPEKFLAYCRKCSKRKGERVAVEQTPFIFSSLKAAKIFAKKANFNVYNNTAELRGFSLKGAIRTSYGTILQIHKQLLFAVEHSSHGFYDENNNWVNSKIFGRSTHAVRQVAGFNVCKIKDTWFVWNLNFSDHMEGSGDLKSVIERAEKRKKKDSLILELNDVRNDRSGTAGFCLAGTKSFLQNRVPFVYRIVAQYNSWAEIPEEIMSTEWHLASRDIFQGYPSPVH